MTLKKSTITIIAQIIILFSLFFVSIIIDKAIIFVLGIVIMIICSTILTFIESRKIIKVINNGFNSNEYQIVIDFLTSKIDKNYFKYTNNICLVYLALFCMYNDEAPKAKELIINNSVLKNSKELYYSRYIIALAENNKQEADFCFDKVMNLKHSQFNVQKETIVKIKAMIDSNICDNDILENTKIPLLKKICRKISGEEVLLDSFNSIKMIEEIPLVKTKGIYKFVKIILNILSCLTLHIGLFVIALSIEKYKVITSSEGLYRSLQMIWVMFLLLPISLGNIVYGLFLKSKKYKYRSNIIIGLIFSIFLFLYGSMSVLSIGQYKEDKDYLYNLEKNIDADFPEEFTIVTSDWTRGEQTSSDNTLLRYESVVRFRENTKLSFNKKWIDELTINEMLPTLFILQTTNYEKFMIYCFDTKEYNPKTINKGYEYVAIAYDEDNNNLLIYEFYLK